MERNGLHLFGVKWIEWNRTEWSDVGVEWNSIEFTSVVLQGVVPWIMSPLEPTSTKTGDEVCVEVKLKLKLKTCCMATKPKKTFRKRISSPSSLSAAFKVHCERRVQLQILCRTWFCFVSGNIPWNLHNTQLTKDLLLNFVPATV